MDSKEQRIATLAATLKASGIAKSDAQAKMMAEDMVGVEEHVQKNYEEKHAQAQEYIQTAKNLGTPRQKVKVEPVVQPKADVKKPAVRPEGTRMIEPIPSKISEKVAPVKPSDIPPAYTDIPFSGKTLNQAFDHDAHNTHNAALEAIKSQIRSKPLIEELTDADMSGKSDESLDAPAMKKEAVMQDIDEILEAPEAPKNLPSQKELIQEIELDSQVLDDEPLSVAPVDAVAPVDTELDTNTVPTDPDITPDEDVHATLNAETDVVTTKEADVLNEAPAAVPEEHPKLDAQKLVELMEEDGKLEEHTREIKEKPTNVKPKEAYEENNIDLGSVFNFNKK